MNRITAQEQACKNQPAITLCRPFCDKLSGSVSELKANASNRIAGILIKLENRDVPAGKPVDGRYGYLLAACRDGNRVHGRVKHQIGQGSSFRIKVIS